jgi:hypothetical protein
VTALKITILDQFGKPARPAAFGFVPSAPVEERGGTPAVDLVSSQAVPINAEVEEEGQLWQN